MKNKNYAVFFRSVECVHFDKLISTVVIKYSFHELFIFKLINYSDLLSRFLWREYG